MDMAALNDTIEMSQRLAICLNFINQPTKEELYVGEGLRCYVRKFAWNFALPLTTP